jgi:hypothetical protein
MIKWDFEIYNFFLDNFEGIKRDYDNLFLPFFYREKVKIAKVQVYSLNLPQKRKDIIWELLNGDLLIEEIRELDKTSN